MIVEKIFIVETGIIFIVWMFYTERKFRREQRAAYSGSAFSRLRMSMIELGKAFAKLG